MSQENFLQAAFRHTADAEILYHQQRYDNAMYHYGFAAECAVKEIARRLSGGHIDTPKSYSHSVDILLQDEPFFDMMNESIAFLNPALLLGIDALRIPQTLIDGHPERRYFLDDSYTQGDCEQVQPCIRDMMDFLMKERLDTGEWEGIF